MQQFDRAERLIREQLSSGRYQVLRVESATVAAQKALVINYAHSIPHLGTSSLAWTTGYGCCADLTVECRSRTGHRPAARATASTPAREQHWKEEISGQSGRDFALSYVRPSSHGAHCQGNELHDKGTSEPEPDASYLYVVAATATTDRRDSTKLTDGEKLPTTLTN